MPAFAPADKPDLPEGGAGGRLSVELGIAEEVAVVAAVIVVVVIVKFGGKTANMPLVAMTVPLATLSSKVTLVAERQYQAPSVPLKSTGTGQVHVMWV